MKSHYTISGIILITLAIVALFSMDHFGRKADATKAKLVAAIEMEKNELQHVSDLRVKLGQANKGHLQVTKFLKNWSVAASDGNNVGNIVDRMVRLATDRGLIATRRPTPINETYPFGTGTSPVQQVSFMVTGSYSSVIGWLGDVEASFPFARPDQIEIKGRGNEIEMQITLAFLLVDGAPKS